MAETIFTIPVSSTAILKGVLFEQLSEKKCSLSYSYEGEHDFSIIFENLLFDGVESFKCTYFRACSLEMLEAYDQIIIVRNSAWLNEIKQNSLRYDQNENELKHLRVYFDDGPCYEFICRSFEFVNEKRKITQ